MPGESPPRPRRGRQTTGSDSRCRRRSRAIEGERARQIELLEEGRPVIQETRRWDDNKEYSYAMRSKEDAKDYRYFPDPDLPPVRISDEWIKRIRDAQPELQEEKAKRYMEQYGLSDYDAGLLTPSPDTWEKCLKRQRLSVRCRRKLLTGILGRPSVW